MRQAAGNAVGCRPHEAHGYGALWILTGVREAPNLTQTVSRPRLKKFIQT
jgi:hypothetical protein